MEDPKDTLRRLMLRRGIPYGPPKDRTRLFEDDGVDRGLLFMAYQGSLTDQFEFVTDTWANRDNAPHDSTPKTGQDPLIGQSDEPRFALMPADNNPANIDVTNDHNLQLPPDPWVIMTGGGYFFTPSISALTGALCQASTAPAGPQAGVAAAAAHAQPQDIRSPRAVGLPPTPAAPEPPRPKRPPRPGKPKGAKKSAKAKKGAKRTTPKRKRGKSP